MALQQIQTTPSSSCSCTSPTRTKRSHSPRGVTISRRHRGVRDPHSRLEGRQGLPGDGAVARGIYDPFTGAEHKITYAERFAHQYRQFKMHAAQTKTGTPLDLLPHS